MSLSAHARLTISDDDRDLPGAFGGGCASLLEGVAEEGSLNRAAKRMGMAYSKAWRIVREAEGIWAANCSPATVRAARCSPLRANMPSTPIEPSRQSSTR